MQYKEDCKVRDLWHQLFLVFTIVHINRTYQYSYWTITFVEIYISIKIKYFSVKTWLTNNADLLQCLTSFFTFVHLLKISEKGVKTYNGHKNTLPFKNFGTFKSDERKCLQKK